MRNIVVMQQRFSVWNAENQRARAEYERRESYLARQQAPGSLDDLPEFCRTGKHLLTQATISWQYGRWRCMKCRNDWQRKKYRKKHPIQQRTPPPLTIREEHWQGIVQQYADGALIRDLAAEHGVSRPTMLRTLRRAGATIRGRHESARMAQPKGYLHLTDEQREEIVARYIKGESSSDLALAFGVSPMTTLRTLRNAGVPRRTKSESLKLSYAKRRASKREKA